MKKAIIEKLKNSIIQRLQEAKRDLELRFTEEPTEDGCIFHLVIDGKIDGIDIAIKVVNDTELG